jgi:hypothetical protein
MNDATIARLKEVADRCGLTIDTSYSDSGTGDVVIESTLQLQHDIGAMLAALRPSPSREGPPATVYHVSAYDEAGYGEDCSKYFTANEEQAAVNYAKSLDDRFGAVVDRHVPASAPVRVYPAASRSSREEVARIVDPEAFQPPAGKMIAPGVMQYATEASLAARKTRALAKADRILALRPASSGGAWRPIEEAPTDGTPFLAFWKAPLADEPAIIIARWNTDAPWIGFYGLNTQSLNGSGTISHLSGGVDGNELFVTHWQPLPAPPADPVRA